MLNFMDAKLNGFTVYVLYIHIIVNCDCTHFQRKRISHKYTVYLEVVGSNPEFITCSSVGVMHL